MTTLPYRRVAPPLQFLQRVGFPGCDESVTKFVPSAKADSVGSTSDYPALRAGLSHAAATRLGIRFVSPLVASWDFDLTL
jgi:hypothetical protein